VLGLEPDGALRLLDRQGRLFSVYHGEIRIRPVEGRKLES
jgi:hypothetical protein